MRRFRLPRTHMKLCRCMPSIPLLSIVRLEVGLAWVQSIDTLWKIAVVMSCPQIVCGAAYGIITRNCCSLFAAQHQKKTCVATPVTGQLTVGSDFPAQILNSFCILLVPRGRFRNLISVSIV